MRGGTAFLLLFIAFIALFSIIPNTCSDAGMFYLIYSLLLLLNDHL